MDPLKIYDPFHTQWFLFTVFIFVALLVLFTNAQARLGLSEISTELYFFFICTGVWETCSLTLTRSKSVRVY